MAKVTKLIINATQKNLSYPSTACILPESKEFIVENVDWGMENAPKRERISSTPWRYIQGDSVVCGPLIGGCTDVLMNTIIGTKLWPELDDFNNAILFYKIQKNNHLPNGCSIGCAIWGRKEFWNGLQDFCLLAQEMNVSKTKKKNLQRWILSA